MAACHQPRFSRQVHLDIKYHMAVNLLVTDWHLVVSVELEGRHDILHFLCHPIAPEGRPRFFINPQRLVDTLRSAP